MAQIQHSFSQSHLKLIQVSAALMAIALIFSIVVGIVSIAESTGPQELEIVNPASFAPGPGSWVGRTYAYYPGRMSYSVERETGELPYLSFTIPNDGETYFGFGFTGPYQLGANGQLVFHWRVRGFTPDIQLHLSEIGGASESEVHSRVIPVVGEDWVETRIELESFSLNQFQDPSQINDELLDPSRIAKIELGFLAGSDMTIDIQKAYFRWDIPSRSGLPVLLVSSILLVFLFVRSQNVELLVSTRPVLVHPHIANRMAIAILVIAFSLGTLIDAQGMNRAGFVIGAIYLVITALFTDVDYGSLRSKSWWSYRFLLALIPLSLGIETQQVFLTYAIVTACLLPLSERGKRIDFFTGFLFTFLFATVGSFGRGIEPLLYTLLSASAGWMTVLVISQVMQADSQFLNAQEMLQLYDSLFHNSTEAIFTLDKDLILRSVNPGMARFLARTPESLLGSPISDHVAPGEKQLVHSVPTMANTRRDLEMGFISGTGETKFALVRIQALKQKDGISSYLAVATDISKRKELEEQLLLNNQELKQLSERDPLTSLANRRVFDQLLRSQWGMALEKRQAMALCLIDVDYFKEYNDSCGHVEGDNCLQTVASKIFALSEAEPDSVARYGGEEFAVIIAPALPEKLTELGEKIRAGVESMGLVHPGHPQGDSEKTAVLTVSLGIGAIIPARNLDPRDLLKLADKALYLSKRAGRNRVTYMAHSTMDL